MAKFNIATFDLQSVWGFKEDNKLLYFHDSLLCDK